MQFSVKWAASAACYVGMAYGAWQMVSQGAATPSAFGVAFGLAVGSFFGAALAMPLMAVNLIAGVAAHRLGRAQPFAVQFGIFAALSATSYFAIIVPWLAKWNQSVGGARFGRDDVLMQGGFVIATLVLAYALMAAIKDSRH